MSLDDLQAQLRGALDQQFAALRNHYENAIAEARQQARADAEHELQAKLVAAHAEWEAQLQAQVAAVRQDVERASAEAGARLRAEFEAARDAAVASSRRSVERELEAERQRARGEIEHARGEAEQARGDAERARGDAERARVEIEAEKQNARREIDAVPARLEGEVATAREAAAAAAAKASVAAQTAAGASAASIAMYDRVATGIRTLDVTTTLGASLDALTASAGAIAGRAALFIVNGDRLKAWKSAGIPDMDVQTVESSIGGRDLLARAIQAGCPTTSSPDVPVPPFARLPPERVAVAAPLMIAGRAVAVLYVDSGADGVSGPGTWQGAVDLLARHASALLALRTAMRTFDMLRGEPEHGGTNGGSGEEGARRYAKLLVSEIKLYNEGAVQAGRQQRDLLRRLRAEIERAQRLYDERVPPAVSGRDTYFHQELVQTLAGGDASLLGT